MKPLQIYMPFKGHTINVLHWSHKPNSPKYLGKTFLLIHGSPGTVADWESFPNRLFELGYNVVAFDRPGFGQSTNDSLTKSVHTNTEVTFEIINHMNLSHVIVYAHSFGASIAMDILSELEKQPNPIIQKFYLSSGFVIHFPGLGPITPFVKLGLSDLLVKFVDTLGKTDKLFMSYVKGWFVEKQYFEHYLTNNLPRWANADSSITVLHEMRDLHLTLKQLDTMTLKIDTPVYIFNSKNELPMIIEQSDRLAQTYDKVEHKLVESGGHFQHIENLDELMEFIKNTATN